MKKILCYGDSNTFGFNPSNGLMFDKNIRWTDILQNNLINEFEVINEGFCDRTGFTDNPKGFIFSAQKHFPKILSDISFIDILILAIGTNDLQFQYNITSETIKNGLEKLINTAKAKSGKIIIIPPVKLNEQILKGYFKCQFDQTSIDKSKHIDTIYKNTAKEFNCFYFDINEFTKPSDIDGLHYSEFSHNIIACKLTDFIHNIIQS